MRERQERKILKTVLEIQSPPIHGALAYDCMKCESFEPAARPCSSSIRLLSLSTRRREVSSIRCWPRLQAPSCSVPSLLYGVYHVLCPCSCLPPPRSRVCFLYDYCYYYYYDRPATATCSSFLLPKALPWDLPFGYAATSLVVFCSPVPKCFNEFMFYYIYISVLLKALVCPTILWLFYVEQLYCLPLLYVLLIFILRIHILLVSHLADLLVCYIFLIYAWRLRLPTTYSIACSMYSTCLVHYYCN